MHAGCGFASVSKPEAPPGSLARLEGAAALVVVPPRRRPRSRAASRVFVCGVCGNYSWERNWRTRFGRFALPSALGSQCDVKTWPENDDAFFLDLPCPKVS